MLLYQFMGESIYLMGEPIDRSIKGMQGAAGVLESNSPSKAAYIGVGGSS